MTAGTAGADATEGCGGFCRLKTENIDAGATGDYPAFKLFHHLGITGHCHQVRRQRSLTAINISIGLLQCLIGFYRCNRTKGFLPASLPGLPPGPQPGTSGFVAARERVPRHLRK